MVSTFTPNLGFEEPARNDLVGVWDTPWNSNSTLLDLVTGGIATIPLNNSNVVLSGTQFQSKTIVFNSTLTGNVTVTFPSTFVKSYEIQNLCTGTSAFTILMTTPTANSLFVASEGAAHLLRLRLDPQTRRPAGTERLLEDVVDIVSGVAVAPDGAIYFATSNSVGRIVRDVR